MTISSPSIRAFRAGTVLSAWTAAWRKKLIKPSLTPCCAWNVGWTSVRRAIRLDKSASLKVVKIAAVCWALTSRSAILRRMGDIFFRVSRSDLEDGDTTAASASEWIRTGDGVGWVSRAGVLGSGVSSAFSLLGISGGVDFREGAFPGWRLPTVWPTFTSVPSGTRISIVPSASANTSEVTLSVSISNRASPEDTASPFFFFQLPRTPEVIDSPTDGTRMGRRVVAVLIFSFSFGWWIWLLKRQWVFLSFSKKELRLSVGLQKLPR